MNTFKQNIYVYVKQKTYIYILSSIEESLAQKKAENVVNLFKSN